MVVDNHFADGQSQSQVGELPVVPPVGEVWFKDVRQRLRWDTRAVVRHDKADGVVAGKDLDVDAPFLFGVVLQKSDAVGHQTGQHDDKFVGVQIHLDFLFGQRIGHIDIGAAGKHLQVPEQILQKQIEEHRLQIE